MLLAEQAGGGAAALDGCPATLGPIGNLTLRFLGAPQELSA